MGPVPEALRKYESIRIPHATAVQHGSVSVAKQAFAGKGMSELDWYKENTWSLAHKPRALPRRQKSAHVTAVLSKVNGVGALASSLMN